MTVDDDGEPLYIDNPVLGEVPVPEVESAPVPPTGAYLGPQLDPKGAIQKSKCSFGNAESLRPLQGEYVFFSPALLYLHGRFKDSVLVDFMVLLQQDVQIGYCRFNKPLFRGLVTSRGETDWNHTLWVVFADVWELLLDFLCSLGMVYREEGLTIRYGMQEFSIIDPLENDRSGFVDGGALTKVFVLGVNSNKQIVAMRQPHVHSLPRVVIHPPSEDMVRFGKALFLGRNPLNPTFKYTGDT